jgi:conjugal transfer pilus assembly protein TraW
MKGIIIALILLITSAQAKDLGTRGHTYKIVEQGFLEMIDERLQKVDMEKEQKKIIEVVKDRVANPTPVEAIKPATKYRKFYFSPMYILEKDIMLPCGKILHKAGTKVNSLEEMQKSGQSLDRRMFFVDASRERQVKWLKKQLKAPLVSAEENKPVEDRIILIGGSPFQLKEELVHVHKHEVYFDQNGTMTSEFGIKASPAVVVQDGLRLKIEEIMLKK